MKEVQFELNCVKKEEDDEEFDCEMDIDIKQYRISSSYDRNDIKYIQNEDNFIGFLDNDIIIEKNIKSDVLKEENEINNFYCNVCGREYKGYCLKCSTLSHILNDINPKLKSNFLPENILKIKNISSCQGVVALKTIPKGIIFGPFNGLSPKKSTNRFMWKIKDGKLMNVENGNWMKYISYSVNTTFKNLDVFQINGSLYFETNREIQEHEELFVYHEMQKLHKSNKLYFIPTKKKKLFKIFACSVCCLGFHSEKCLIEHKSKCPYTDRNKGNVGIDLMECSCCKMWLEKREYLEYHADYCWENYLKGHEYPKINDLREGHTSPKIKTQETKKQYQCHLCSHRTNYKRALNLHIKTHSAIKLFRCDVCIKEFTQKKSLDRHKCGGNMRRNYSNLNKYIKEREGDSSDPKRFQCNICNRTYTQKGQLRLHILDKHTEGDEKRYQCANCSYKSNHKGHLQTHLLTHLSDKPRKEFDNKYKCSKCPYVTSRKPRLTSHLIKHGDVEPFLCKLCGTAFTREYSLKQHTKNIHENRIVTHKFKCPFCSYKTTSEIHFVKHQTDHERGKTKRYECHACERIFSRSTHLKLHVKDKHAEGEAKDYRCKLCPYETNRNDLFKMHLKNKHAEGGAGKDYKCLQCPFETNYKEIIKKHFYKHVTV